MESAPLTLAHTHARNAVLETRKSNPVAASEEHDLAAGEFATAAHASSDQEALRTLQLLEQHHKKLASILRFQHEHPPSADPVGAKSSPSAQDTQQHPPKLSSHVRLPPRETSSIASDLASARGIPSHPRRASPASPTLSSQQAGAKMIDGPSKIKPADPRTRGPRGQGAKEQSSRRETPSASPTDVTSKQFVPPESVRPARSNRAPPATEEPFNRFYSTVEGLISKISAPLAFAGLPLGGNEPAQPSRKSTAEAQLDRHHATSDRNDPDINKLFSRAALRAIRDSSSGGTGTGTGGTPSSAAESFYVVPTTGGTVSYAGILTRAEREARRNSVEEADEDFVDARETPSMSPELRQGGSSSGARSAAAGRKPSNLQNGTKTMEELQMENQALRHLSDTLSKRLHMWEVNAQSSSMALQQSLRAMHHHQNVPSPEQRPQSASSAVTSPSAGAGAGAGAPAPSPAAAEHDQRIKELEELIQRSEKQLDKVGRENKALRDTIARYRGRWETLKAGAKNRRAGGKPASEAERDSVPASPAIESSTPIQEQREEPGHKGEPGQKGEPETKEDAPSNETSDE